MKRSLTSKLKYYSLYTLQGYNTFVQHYLLCNWNSRISNSQDKIIHIGETGSLENRV